MLPILLSSSVYSLTPDFSCSISFSFFSIVSRVVFSFPGRLFFYWLPFYLLQFLSNLPQYSWSYLLFVHPNNLFAVNLPGNSSFLNVPSSFSCFLTSSISYLYFFSNSSIASLAFPKFSFPSQVFDSTINPFYYTRYLSFPLIFHLFNILSTSHSSSPSIITGAGCSFLCSSICPT